MSSDQAGQALHLAEQLLALLELEASALAEQDLEQLQTLPGEKQSLLDALEQQQALLADYSPEQTAPLRRVLEQCQAANQRNGRVIHSQQASNKSLLSLLRGGDERLSTYTPLGSRTSAPSLSLGLA
ncbi:hypothetical protein AXE65_12200 [Ventosimonas gracilis]|uniref:Flagellar biosynthesis protein FlgN n=2 Tax=Ventosimonas gracilis TaxID=1680762 RepID=A0A139SVX3_9GAMM|nr:hypothetical protein AXE65_12200 [Ventosimonas gracilis]